MVLFYLGELFSLSSWWDFQQDANGVEKGGRQCLASQIQLLYPGDQEGERKNSQLHLSFKALH